MADGKVIYEITGDNSGFQGTVNETEKISAKGFDNIKAAGATAFKAIGVAAAAALGTVTATIGAVVKSTSELAAYGDNIDKMSQKMGMSAEAYQEWDAIMQHSGTSMEAMQGSMKKLAIAAETDSEAFAQLGLSQAEIANMSQEELFSATITALQGVESETERTYLATKLLGGGATELGALLNTSAEDTEAMRQRVHELGGVLSDEAVSAAATFQDNLQDMQTALSGLKNGVISDFLPAINDMMEGFTALLAGEEGATEQMQQGIDEFLASFSETGTKIFEIAQQLLPTLIEGVVSNLPALVEMGVGLIMTIADALINNLPMIAESAIKIIVALINGLSNSLPQLIAKAPELVIALAKAIISSAPELLKAGAQLIGTLLKAIGDMVSKFFDVGANLLEGLKEGVVSKARALKDSVVNAVKGAWESAKRFLGINSPSKLFMQVGAYVDEGFAEGIENSAETPKRSIRQMLGGITDVTVPTMPTATPAMAGPSIVNTETTASRGATGGNNTIVMQVGRIPFGQVTYNSNQEESTVHGVNYIARR